MARPSTFFSDGRGPPSVSQLGSPFEPAPRVIPTLSSDVVPNGGGASFTSPSFPSRGDGSLSAPLSGHPSQVASSSHAPVLAPGSVPSSAYLAPHPVQQETPRKARSRPKKGSKPPKLTFVQALYKLLANPDVYFCARWDDEGGRHILIQDSEKLMTFVRKDPNFKMTMMPSFTRQLNIYGFLKRYTCAEAFPGYEPLDSKVLAIWTHEYLHKNSSALDIANVKRRVVEPSRTDAEESPTALYQVPQVYPVGYSQPLQPPMHLQPVSNSDVYPPRHRHGLSFEYEDAQQPTTPVWSNGPSRPHEVRPHHSHPVPRHQHSMQNLRQPYYSDSPVQHGPSSRHPSSSTYHLPPPPPAEQQPYDPYTVDDEYESGPSFDHHLRHQTSFTSESSTTSSVYEMEGSSNSEVEMGMRTPPRTFDSSIHVPTPIRLEYPLDHQTHWGTLPHVSPPVQYPAYDPSSKTLVPKASLSRSPGHQHPLRYAAWNPSGGRGTFAPPSPPSMEEAAEEQEGLVYADGLGPSSYVGEEMEYEMVDSGYGGSQGPAMG